MDFVERNHYLSLITLPEGSKKELLNIIERLIQILFI
jgi:hypothetical protein